MRRLRKTYSDYGIDKKIVNLKQDVIHYKTNQLYGTNQIKATYIGTNSVIPYHYYTEWGGYKAVKGIVHITGSYPNRPIQARMILSGVPGYHTPDGFSFTSSIEYVGKDNDNELDIYITYRAYDNEYSGDFNTATMVLYTNMSATWSWEDLGWQLAP